MGWKGKHSKNYFAVSLWKDLKGIGCFVSEENLQDPVDHFFNARKEVSRNFLKQNRKSRITKNTKSGTLAEFLLSLQFKRGFMTPLKSPSLPFHSALHLERVMIRPWENSLRTKTVPTRTFARCRITSRKFWRRSSRAFRIVRLVS